MVFHACFANILFNITLLLTMRRLQIRRLPFHNDSIKERLVSRMVKVEDDGTRHL